MAHIDFQLPTSGCPVCGINFDCPPSLYDGACWFFCLRHKLRWRDPAGREDAVSNAVYLCECEEVEPAWDLRETADWIAGNRAEILRRLIADSEAAPPAAKVEVIEIPVQVDAGTYAYLMREYGGG
ncbi:MAG: hypothetical protein WBY44_21825 [Bryobacteraceae bacterium]